MGMFSRLFGSKSGKLPPAAAKLSAPTPGKPTFIDAVPNRVVVDFYAHDGVEGVLGNFLTAVTEGLAKSRQPELVLTVRLSPAEDPLAKMREIVRFVTTVHAWASEGNLVHAGGFTQFGERGLFGRAHSGLVYADARAIPGVRLPERALAAVLVDAQEIRAALDYGVYRVLTRIGLQLRLFPYPIWSDLERPGAMTPKETESLLTKVARLRAPGVSFVLEDECLRVSIPSDTTELLRGLSSLPADAPFALLTRPAASANAILVWRPGLEGTNAISADGTDGSRLSGSCLMVVPVGDRDQIRPIEDGYSVLFSKESWAVLATALLAQRPMSLNMADDMRFQIEWLPRAASS